MSIFNKVSKTFQWGQHKVTMGYLRRGLELLLSCAIAVCKALEL